MKKLLIVAGLLLASTFAFANIELDVNMYGTLAKAMATENIDENSEGKKVKIDYTQPFAFGFEDNVTFYFGHRESKFDAGLSLFLNLDFFNKAEVKTNGNTSSFSGSGINLGLGVGPAFRITFANPFSLFIRPTLSFNLFVFETEDIKDKTTGSSYKSTIAEFDLFRFDLNVGGRSWLLNVDGFHLGIDYGAIIGLGAGFGATGRKGSGSSSSGDGFGAGTADFKIYLGCCMNFGDRGYDRM